MKLPRDLEHLIFSYLWEVKTIRSMMKFTMANFELCWEDVFFLRMLVHCELKFQDGFDCYCSRISDRVSAPL
jgi:hypothetical protein